VKAPTAMIFPSDCTLISFTVPVNPTPEDKNHYRDFIINLQYVLPCKYCRMNLTNNLKKKPLQMCDMASRDTFSRYIYELHETINKMLGKKSHLTYCQVRDRYENFRSRCTEEKGKVFTYGKLATTPLALLAVKPVTKELYTLAKTVGSVISLEP